MGVVAIILTIAVMLIGLAGSVLPVVPGLPIIFVAYLGYGIYSGWQAYAFWTMVLVGGVVVLSVVLDQLASAMGAKKFGAGKAGMIGAFVGAILGAIFFNIVGLIAGTFVGAAVFELVFARRDLYDSLKAGTGALVGFLASSVFKFMLGTILIALYLFKVVMNGAP
ncbi:MAG: DUF456 domain-containing protein [Deltaproteobacteria bacterium]|jgi:uncharacterized protein YqgC (DUF456 family)|nr:DUF456 domain-containing protein [Deltaproteobacteria bacterium]